MVANSKPTRNSDHRHAQSIGRQRQAAQRAAADGSPLAEELLQSCQAPSALHRDSDDPQAAPYCYQHDTRFFRDVWKNGRVSWSHRKADGSGFCRYKG
jgi:hypothetical protein